MGNVKSNLSATITAVDVDSKQPLTRDIGSPSFDGAAGEYDGFQNLAAGETVITPEGTVITCLWVRNRHASNTLSVKATPQGGAEAILGVLAPGASLLVWNPTAAATVGYTSLKLTPSGANTPVEIYMGV